MEVALVRFIGAGLVLVFEGFDEDVPVGAVAEGYRLVAAAGLQSGEIVMPAIERITRDIWREWRLAKLPRPLAQSHLEALPQLMDRYRVSRGLLIGAVSVAQAAQRTGSQAPGHSARVASGIVGECKAAGLFDKGELSESIAFFFVDRLLAHLLKDPQLFVSLLPVYRSFIASRAWIVEASEAAAASDAMTDAADDSAVAAVANGAADEDVRLAVVTPIQIMPALQDAPAGPAASASSDPATSAASQAISRAIARVAAEQRIPEAALAPFAAVAMAGPQEVSVALLEEAANGLRVLMARLAEPPGGAHDTDTRGQIEIARGRLATGDAKGADNALAAAQARMTRAAQGAFGGSSGLLTGAAEIGGLRGLLAETLRDWAGAAIHYGAAARGLPSDDRLGRWNHLISQALALERKGREDDDTATLVDAVHVHSDAARLLSEQDAPADWAETHLALGNLLLEVGAREKRVERSLAAALHFKPALDVFSQLHDSDNWARAQLGMAEALRCQGDVQGDVETLSEAAFAYRAALGVLTRDRMPPEWLTASFGLGAALLRQGQEAGDIAPLEEAADSLRGALAAAEHGGPVSVGAILAKLGHVLLALGAARSDVEMIADAAAALEGAIAEEHVPLPEAATAAALDALGSALLVLAETAGDTEATLRAAEAKDAALAYYQSIGEEGLVESLTRELEEIVARLPESRESAQQPASA